MLTRTFLSTAILVLTGMISPARAADPGSFEIAWRGSSYTVPSSPPSMVDAISAKTAEHYALRVKKELGPNLVADIKELYGMMTTPLRVQGGHGDTVGWLVDWRRMHSKLSNSPERLAAVRSSLHETAPSLLALLDSAESAGKQTVQLGS